MKKANRTQTISHRAITAGLAIGLLFSSGCKSSTSQSAASPTVPQASNVSPSSQPTAPAIASVTIYTAAADCVTYVPQKVEVSKDNAVTDAVGKVLASQPAIATKITDYTVKRDGDIATVDFQPSPQQSISTLSLCEQFALFGSLRETLVQEPNWGIKTVRFTEGGKELGL